MVRTAVIGLTSAGYEHARAYRGDARTELVGVCDEDDGRLREVARQLGVPLFTTTADLFGATHPNLVTVSCPVPKRAETIRAALGAGINVLSSVPFGEDLDAVRELVAMARERGLILAGDFHLRFTPTVAKAREWLASDSVGPLLFANMSLWTRGDESDGPHGLLRDLGVHGVDLMRHFCGDVIRVQCFGVKAPRRSAVAVWSSVQVNMQFVGGAVGNLTASYDMVPHHPMARFELAGMKARLVIENVYEEAILYPHAEEEKRVVTNSIFGGVAQLKDTYGLRIRRLLDQMADGTSPDGIDGGANDALAAAAVAQAAIEALESESVVVVA